jgi:hypothetical protein
MLLSALSIGENHRSIAACVIELFQKQWSTLYFEMDNNHAITQDTRSNEHFFQATLVFKQK